MAKKKSYMALGFIIDGDRTIESGEVAEFTDAQAKHLLEAEVIEEVEVQEEEKKK